MCIRDRVVPPAGALPRLTLDAPRAARVGERIHTVHRHSARACSTVSSAAGSASRRSAGIGRPLRNGPPERPAVQPLPVVMAELTAASPGRLPVGGCGAALVAQGAYYLRAQVCVAGLIGAALLVTPGLTWVASSDRSIVLAVGALAGWAVIDAAFHDNPRAAVPYVVLLAGVVAVLVACSRLDEAARDLLLTGLIACGVLVAALGWLGLVLHDARWTWQGQGLWRASSTLTYPNATAVILAMLALLAVAFG